MKNIFRFLMAAVIFFGAVSCAKEDISSSLAGGEVEVTFTANLPELGTRAYGDGLNATLLRYYVYDANGEELPQLRGTATTTNRTFSFTLPLIKGMTYDFVLWADKNVGDVDNPQGFYQFDGKIATINYNGEANNNDRDAFYGFKRFDPLKDTPKFFLRRPFAQLNAATSDKALVAKSGVELTTSTITVKAYDKFDVTTGDIAADAQLIDVAFTAATMPCNLNPVEILKNGYDYLSMNYLLVPKDGMVINPKFTFKGTNGTNEIVFEETEYTNVPLKQNYRTNILGQLLTKSTEIEVEILPGFGGADEDITVNTVSNAEELKNAIIRGGYIEFANDITVDKWIMFSETLTTSDSSIITIDKIDVNIDGKGHTLTVKDFERTGNGGRLFYNASNLNIANLNIKYPEGAAFGGLYFQSGVIKDVNFISGGVAIAPGSGNIKVENCTFATNDTAIYFEKECDNLTVTGCTFNQPDGKNVILLRGDVKFTDNIINSGRTVNIVSGSPVVTGNNFHDVRLKVYAAATATVANNTINTLEFEKNYHSSTFTNNTLSAAAQAALDAVIPSMVSTSDALKAILAQDIDDITITLEAGTYEGLSFINPANYKAKNVTIIGKEGVKITGFSINSWSGTSNINIEGLTFKNVTFTSGLLLSTKVMSNVKVENCDFINDACIHQNDSSEKLTNLVVKDCTFVGVAGGNTTALMLENTENVSVTGCTFTNIDYNVMQCGIIKGNILFDHNIVNGTGDRVFRFVNTAEANITISNNTITSNGDSNGELAKASNPTDINLSNNTWNGNSDAEVADKLININNVKAISSVEDFVGLPVGAVVKLANDITGNVTLPAGVEFNGNGKQINGTLNAGGDVTFVGHTKVTAFSAGYYNRTITIDEGACLEVTGTGRVSVAYGNTFDITGNVSDAKTADKTTIQPSLIIPGGISITGGNDAVFNITNAYVKIGSTTSKPGVANGEFTFNIVNSIAEFTKEFGFYDPTGGVTPVFKLNATNSVFTTGTKLYLTASSKVKVDNSTVKIGSYLRNSGEIELKNGSVLTGATIQFGESAGHDGATVVDNSTFTITTGNNAGNAFDGKGTGSITAKNGANVSIQHYKGLAINTDATSRFTGTEVQ